MFLNRDFFHLSRSNNGITEDGATEEDTGEQHYYIWKFRKIYFTNKPEQDCQTPPWSSLIPVAVPESSI